MIRQGCGSFASLARDEILIKRRGNSWRIEGDDKDRANPALIRDVLKLAANLQYSDRIDVGSFGATTIWATT